MLTQIGLDGVSREISQITQVDVDGTTVRQLAELWQNDASGVPRLIFSAGGGGSGASVAPDYVQGSRSSRNAQPVTTSPVTVTLGRGSPTSLVWSFADGGWSSASPGSLSTSFRSPPLGPDSEAATTAFVTATYSSGPDAVSNTISLFASNFYYDTGLS